MYSYCLFDVKHKSMKWESSCSREDLNRFTEISSRMEGHSDRHSLGENAVSKRQGELHSALAEISISSSSMRQESGDRENREWYNNAERDI